MFVAMNHFKVVEGKEEDFERIWRERESKLQAAPGFVQFALLKGEGDREYVSHTTWRDRGAFIAWTESEAFASAHGRSSPAGLLEGPPQLRTYQAIIVETPEGRVEPAG